MFIVPCPWAGPARRLPERRDHEVGDAARGLDVAGGDRGRRARVEQAALRARRPRSAGGRRPTAARRDRSARGRRSSAAERVTDSGQLRLPSTCVVGPGEVEPQRSRRRSSPSTRSGQVALGPSARPRARRSPRRSPSGQLAERRARAPLGVVEDLRHPARAGRRRRGARPARAGARSPTQVRGPLRAQVGEPLARVAHPLRELLELLVVDARRRDHHALLLEACVESAGIPAGVGPPTSAWWARLAAKPSSSRRRVKTGEISVMSGRWVPPR